MQRRRDATYRWLRAALFPHKFFRDIDFESDPFQLGNDLVEMIVV
jgi:hypothetical protein